MFHSAGYFRSVVCPFYEHGLCHRPHCHYRHSKPATKSAVKKLPKLRSRLVALPQKDPSAASTSTDKPASDTNSEKESLKTQDGKPDHPVSSTSPTGQTNSSSSSSTREEMAGEAGASEKFISEVSKVIGKIASFYGSGLEDSGNTSGDATNSNIDDKAGPPADDAMITSSPDVSSEQIVLTITTTATPPNTITSLPSYAPTVVESNYEAPRESSSTKIAAKSEDKIKVPCLLDATELGDVLPSVTEMDVATLESMLVTEKDIFGDRGRISDDEDSDNDIHGEGVAMDTETLNAEELAWIEAEFKKITALPSTAGETSTADKTSASKDKKPQKAEKFIDVSLKKKRVAHANTKVVREPVKLRTTPSVSSNFGGSLDKNAVYMGKKRLAKPSEEAPAAKRPKLALTPNARIPTKIRQRFLDSFIDEFLKTSTEPQQAYEKALNEEKVLFERASNRMIYMNVSTLALKRIRNQTAAQLAQLKDALAEALKEYNDELTKMEKVAITADLSSNSSGKGKESSHVGGSKMLKMKGRGEGKAMLSKTEIGVEKKKKGWRLLEAELQDSFSGETSLTTAAGSGPASLSSSLATGMTSPAHSSLARLSSSTSDKAGIASPDPKLSAVFSSSQFYSKKSQKSSTSSVEGTEAGAKLKTKSKKAHSKKKMLSNATALDAAKSESGDQFGQTLAKMDQVQTNVPSGSTIAPASSEKSRMKGEKMDHPRQTESSPTAEVAALKDPIVGCSKIVKSDPLPTLSSTATTVKSGSRELSGPKLSKTGQLSPNTSDKPVSGEVAGLKREKKSKLKKDKHLPKKARHSKDGTVHRELPKISESFSLASSSALCERVPSIGGEEDISSNASGRNAIPRTKRLSESTESVKKSRHSRDGIPPSTSSKKAKKQETTASLSTAIGRTVTTSADADSLQDILTTLSESRDVLWAEPEAKDSLKKSRCSSDDTPPSTSATSCKKARPSKEESKSAESAEDVLTILSQSHDASCGAEPMDLAMELFGGTDSDSEREERERAVMSDIIERIISKGEGEEECTATESDEVSCSQGISFESALCGVGVAKTKGGGVPNKLKSPKKHKKKSKVKVSLSERIQMDGSEGQGNTRPAKLDVSVFNCKSPTVRLAKIPTGHGSFPLSPTSSSGPTTPTGHMTYSGSTMPTEVSHIGQQSSEAATTIADTASVKETSTAKNTITSPLHMPSGPLINLTKVAAQHKEKQMSYTSLVAKHAAMEKARMKKATLKAPPTTQRKKATPTAAPPTTRQPTKPTFSIIRRKELELTAPLFYSHMKNYVLSEDQLRENSYPRPTARPGEAAIHRDTSSSSQQSSEIRPVGPNAMEHRCSRCSKMFIIYNSGQYQRVEECVYHYGRLVKNKEYGEGLVSKYTCCQGRRDSAGCQVAKFHVTAGERPTLDKGYVTTEVPPTDSAYHPSVYALDCEMCYTTAGLQLTRVSVINMSLQPIYEKLVKPSHPIVDYNTRFSGLTSEDLVGVETTLEDVQADLLKLFFTDTILLGHSLESDLTALKLIHSCVVDTAIVFPHRKGLPYKRALKTLMAEYMQKFIQDSIDGGHDSLEDSRACMELMLWKIKQDLKKVSRTSSSSDK